MELRHLRYFVAVADKLHFGHAAERLNTSQPSLSQQIRDLEKDELFRRTKHRVELTKAGARFLKEARQILASVDRAGDLARQGGRVARGSLMLGISPETNWQFLREVLRGFAERVPKVEVMFQVLTTGAQSEAVQKGRIDVGFVSLPVEGGEVISECIERAPLMVALPETHRMAKRRTLELVDLAAERYTLWPRDLSPGLYDETRRVFSRAGFGSPVELEGDLPSAQTILGMVAAGLTIALVDPAMQAISTRESSSAS